MPVQNRGREPSTHPMSLSVSRIRNVTWEARGNEPRGVMSQRQRSQARNRKASEICSQRLFRKRAQASKFLTHAGVIELKGPRKSATGTPRMLESQRMSSESVTAKKAR